MYVCICRGINTRTLQSALAQGADSLTDLQQRLGVGTGCGRCMAHADQVLSEHREAVTAPRSISPQENPSSACEL